MIVDTHCHLNLVEHFPDPEAEIAHAASMGVTSIVVVGIDSATNQIALDLADRFEAVWAVVGIHPNSTAKFELSWLDELERQLKHSKALALGEIGLDYHWDFATREQQYDALSAQLDLAARLDMPIVFHCREANGDLLDVLESRQPSQRLLLHCFSGNADEAKRAISLGCYFGVDGPLTYKSANELREIVSSLPQDRIVVETDAPYLTPVPHRGKPNRPGYVSYVNAMLASIWGISVEEAAVQTTENARRFFGEEGLGPPFVDCGL